MGLREAFNWAPSVSRHASLSYSQIEFSQFEDIRGGCKKFSRRCKEVTSAVGSLHLRCAEGGAYASVIFMSFFVGGEKTLTKLTIL